MGGILSGEDIPRCSGWLPVLSVHSTGSRERESDLMGGFPSDADIPSRVRQLQGSQYAEIERERE